MSNIVWRENHWGGMHDDKHDIHVMQSPKKFWRIWKGHQLMNGSYANKKQAIEAAEQLVS